MTRAPGSILIAAATPLRNIAPTRCATSTPGTRSSMWSPV